MTVTLQVLGWVAAERRALDRRQCAIRESANIMEQLAVRPWKALGSGAFEAGQAFRDGEADPPGSGVEPRLRPTNPSGAVPNGSRCGCVGGIAAGAGRHRSAWSAWASSGDRTMRATDPGTRVVELMLAMSSLLITLGIWRPPDPRAFAVGSCGHAPIWPRRPARSTRLDSSAAMSGPPRRRSRVRRMRPLADHLELNRPDGRIIEYRVVKGQVARDEHDKGAGPTATRPTGFLAGASPVSGSPGEPSLVHSARLAGQARRGFGTTGDLPDPGSGSPSEQGSAIRRHAKGAR